MVVTDEKFAELSISYQRFFQFGRSLESGAHAFRIAADEFTDTEINDIILIFKYILDQWNDNLSEGEKEESMEGMLTPIRSLGLSERKELIVEFFESLQDMLPDPNERYCRPRTHC